MPTGSMLNCRSIAPETWEHARQALVFYFTYRLGADNAEDLAHDTLTAILARDDYEFEKEEDFLKVCYGFANHTVKEGIRKAAKHNYTPLEFDPPAPGNKTQGLNEAEARVYLQEILQLGRERLSQKDYEILKSAISLDGKEIAKAFGISDANNVRVRLHRLRKLLAGWAGWGKSQL